MRRFDPGPGFWIAAHRGALPAPENTISSLLGALAEGADLLECDAQLCAGELVLRHDEAFTRDGLPTLAELLRALPGEAHLNVELKRYGADVAATAERALDLLAGRPRTLVSSFDRELLLALRAADPGLPLAPLGERLTPELLALADRLDAWALHLGRSPAAATVRATGRPILVYTVNDARRAARLRDRGVAGLFTDRPGPLRSALSARRPALGAEGSAVV